MHIKLLRPLALVVGIAFFPTPSVAHGEQLLKLTAEDAAAGAFFGSSLALSANRAIVGSPNDSEFGNRAGAAYVFDLSNGNQIYKLHADDAGVFDSFGSSVAVSGNIAVIGARLDNSAYVFDISTGEQLRKLTPDDSTDNVFGTSVAISGTTAVVGAPFDTEICCGAAYVFNALTGEQLHKLTGDERQTLNTVEFGDSVTISGDVILIGSPGDTPNDVRSGSAYLFNATTGLRSVKLTSPDPDDADRFGGAVAIAGNRAIISASLDDNMFQNAGAAYVYDISTGRFEYKFASVDVSAGDFFGQSLSGSGDLVVVGAEGKSNAGAAYLFDVSTRKQLARLIPDDLALGDSFGSRVSIFGGRAAASSPGDDDACQMNSNCSSGSAYVFDSLASPAQIGDYNFDGDVDLGDLEVWKLTFGSDALLNADGNGDGIVDAADYTVWRDNLGAGSGSLTAVPEPSAAVLLIVGLVTIIGRRGASNR